MRDHAVPGISRRPEWPPCRRAFTLAELLVVAAMMAVLAGLLAPSFFRAVERARAGACASNMRQIYAGLLAYASDNDGYLPPNTTAGAWWSHIFPAYVSEARVFACPDDKTGMSAADAKVAGNGKNSYGAIGQDGGNGYISAFDRRLVSFPQAPRTAFLAEYHVSLRQVKRSYFYNYPGYVKNVTYAHNNSSPYLFLDGHVEDLTLDEANGRVADKTMIVSQSPTSPPPR